jgi:hypothetical protein
VRHGEPAPGLLSEAVLDLARTVEDLAGSLEQPNRTAMIPSETVASRFALKAAEEATAVLHERSDLPTSVLVGQIRSTAVDLLRASGMHSGRGRGRARRRGAQRLLTPVLLRRTLERSGVEGMGPSGRASRAASSPNRQESWASAEANR